MRTTITVDDAIIAEVVRLTAARKRSKAINMALSEWVGQKKLASLRALRGKLAFPGDPEQLRAAELDEVEAHDA